LCGQVSLGKNVEIALRIAFLSIAAIFLSNCTILVWPLKRLAKTTINWKRN